MCVKNTKKAVIILAVVLVVVSALSITAVAAGTVSLNSPPRQFSSRVLYSA